jgi:hypothetical protein
LRACVAPDPARSRQRALIRSAVSSSLAEHFALPQLCSNAVSPESQRSQRHFSLVVRSLAALRPPSAPLLRPTVLPPAPAPSPRTLGPPRVLPELQGWRQCPRKLLRACLSADRREGGRPCGSNCLLKETQGSAANSSEGGEQSSRKERRTPGV